MIRISNEVTVVADASKFGRHSLSLIGGIECARRVITDDRVRPEIGEALRAKGVDLVVV
jgi:DeoR/GlpR family transcriptional regulator of sugar metabolism